MNAHRANHESRTPPQIRSVARRKPRFSVAIATRNYGRWLERCLESVLTSYERSGVPIQIVVADDCSTDNTSKILDHYQSKYPQIFTIVNLTTSNGISAAKNAAIRHCRGEYIALLDADDEFAPDKLARCDQALKMHPDTELLTHDYTFINEKTGETFVPGHDWYRFWRPPGVWVFRAGRVLFSEQMICGYEELEWSKRCWYEIRRFHIPETLAIVHGEETKDRWKIDRAVAGLDAMERWEPKHRKYLPHRVFACRGCGNQYFNVAVCCGRDTERVPLVHYMTLSSFPYHSPVEFSIVVLPHDDLQTTRSLCTEVIQEFHGAKIELIFVGCHAERALLNYCRKLSKTVRLKAVFAPRDHAFVYGHDVNRAARAADGRYLVFLDGSARISLGYLYFTLHSAFADKRVDMLMLPPGMQNGPRSELRSKTSSRCQPDSWWAMQQGSFWRVGAVAEHFEKQEDALRDLQHRAAKKKRSA